MNRDDLPDGAALFPRGQTNPAASFSGYFLASIRSRTDVVVFVVVVDVFGVFKAAGAGVAAVPAPIEKPDAMWTDRRRG